MPKEVTRKGELGKRDLSIVSLLLNAFKVFKATVY